MRHQHTHTRLIRYLDGQLSREQQRAIARHLSRCPACQDELAQLGQLSALLRGLPPVELSPDFHARLQARIMETAASSCGTLLGWLHGYRFLISVAGTAALVIGLLVGNLVGTVTSSPGALSQDQYLETVGMDHFQDYPPGSLPHAYVELVSNG